MKLSGGQICNSAGEKIPQSEILETSFAAKLREDLGLKVSSAPVEIRILVDTQSIDAQLGLDSALGESFALIHPTDQGVVFNDTWHPIRLPDIHNAIDWLHSLNLQLGAISLKSAVELRLKANEAPCAISFTSSGAPSRTVSEYFLQGVEPYEYQKVGIGYLQRMRTNGLGCILADEMGLGKTLQAIAILAQTSQESQLKSLVIAPATLLENWRRELAKFAPQLRVKVRKSGRRSFEVTEFDADDVVVTSYDTMTADIGFLSRFSWATLVLDEAQYVKNPLAQRTQMIRRLRREILIAVTGTPFENHISDTWSLVDSVFPGFLGPLRAFESVYSDNVDDAQKLSWIIEPLILRRLVADVAKDLPERVDIPVFLEPTEAMLSLQMQILQDAKRENKGLLSQIQNLRTLAAHARQDDHKFEDSPKFQYLKQALIEILQNGEKALVFSSFNLASQRLTEYLSIGWEDIFINTINGSTPVDDRQNIVDSFSDAKRGVLILNPQAAGVGLNITAANHVFHFNPEWNPALTEQASKRAHRNGQDKPVFVHYMFYSTTVEEMVASSQELKKAIGKALVPGALLPLTESEVIDRLLKLGKV